MSGSLGEREMLSEHEPQASVSNDFFEFSQTFISVSITRQKHGEHVFYFLLIRKHRDENKGKQLVNIDYQNVNSLCWHIITSTAHASSVFLSSYRNTILNQ